MKKSFIRSLALVLTLCMVMSLSAFAAPQEGTYDGASAADPGAAIQFSDVEGHWAEGTIYAMVNEGIINGYSDGTFRPEAGITRAEFVKLLTAAFELPEAGQSTFTDAAGHWAAKNIASAQAFEIVTGDAAGSFKPDEEISRQDMAVILYRLGVKLGRLSFATDNEPAAFADASAFADYAAEAIAAMQKSGVVTGKLNNNFDPLANSTRAETVTIISRVMALPTNLPTQEQTDEAPGYKVTRADEAVEYDPAGHYDVVATRLHNAEDVGASLTLGLSYYEPGGYAEMGAAPVELLYYIVAGEITVTTGDGLEHVLQAGDSIHIAPNVERSPVNTGDTVAQMLVAIAPALADAGAGALGYKVTKADEGVVYDPAGHYGVVATRLHTADDVGGSITLGISDYESGGYAEMGAAPVELIYYIVAGEMTVTTGDGLEHILYAGDSIHFAPYVDRAPVNTGDGTAIMLVFSCTA